jgi:LuxR family transcriptional regulator, maltose regulon positive regulatory protein
VLRLLETSREFPVVCLQAPGGYGKTTVLAEWAAEDARPVIWLSVRPQAPDAVWLAQALVDGLHEAGLVTDHVVLPRGPDPVTWHLGVLPAVEAALAAVGRPILVVIDEAGAMTGSRWDCLASSIATSLPDGAQVALATRTRLPVSLRRLRTSGLVLVLGPETLALDAIEGAALMRLLSATVSDSELLSLVESTEGWPVAICLAGQARAAGQSLPTVGLSPDGELADYLREQILRRLPDPDARFLLRAAVLTYLDEVTCDEATATRGSLARLRRLAESNRLLVALDPSAEQFRMHPLLASFLSDELRTTDPDAWRTVQTAASVARERVGDLDSAVYHARQAEDDARLGALVWRHTGQLMSTGRIAVLQRWLDGVGPERLAAQGELALTAAWLAAQAGDDRGTARLALAAEVCALRDGSASLLSHVRLLQATMAEEGLDAMVAMSRRFIAENGPGEMWLTLAHYLVGVGLQLNDQDEAGLAEIERARRLAVIHGLPVMHARCLATLADAALSGGDRRKAVQHMTEARQVVSGHRLDHLATSAPFFVASARCYVAEGRLAEASQEARRALRLTASTHVVGPLIAVYGRLTLAEVFLALGDQQQARVLVEEVEDAYGPARSAVGDRLLASTRERLRAVTPTTWHSAVLTTAEVRVLQYLPTHLSFPQIAHELFVSRHTVKTQALSAYRKLGAHSRSEAIAKAREIGLLPDS